MFAVETCILPVATKVRFNSSLITAGHCGARVVVMPVPTSIRHGGPSCFDKVKYGVSIGFVVGLSTGAIFGTFTGIRYGLRGRELLTTLGKIMLQTGGTFGVFMGIGSAIRC